MNSEKITLREAYRLLGFTEYVINSLPDDVLEIEFSDHITDEQYRDLVMQRAELARRQQSFSRVRAAGVRLGLDGHPLREAA